MSLIGEASGANDILRQLGEAFQTVKAEQSLQHSRISTENGASVPVDEVLKVSSGGKTLGSIYERLNSQQFDKLNQKGYEFLNLEQLEFVYEEQTYNEAFMQFNVHEYRIFLI